MSDSKTDIVIRIDAHGTVHGLHHDNFDLGFLGPKKIERASEIMFNEASQTFYIELPNICSLDVLKGFLKYDHARAFEVYLLENAAFNNVIVADNCSFHAFVRDYRFRWNNGERDLTYWFRD